jgi:quercetin dioxygenase-like cupin family protein
MRDMTRVTSGTIAAEAGSQLSLNRLDLDAGGRHTAGHGTSDTMLFVRDGSATINETASFCRAGSALLVCAGEHLNLVAGAAGLRADLFQIGAGCDRHAPLGERETVVDMGDIGHGQATGKRSFQILFDGNNGSARATLFVGHIPPGAAPWHYHLYDEIVCVLGGEGRVHLGHEPEPLATGQAFRLSPREVHVVENTSTSEPLIVLGLFTPAGSPSAAYLPDGVARYAHR